MYNVRSGPPREDGWRPEQGTAGLLHLAFSGETDIKGLCAWVVTASVPTAVISVVCVHV